MAGLSERGRRQRCSARLQQTNIVWIEESKRRMEIQRIHEHSFRMVQAADLEAREYYSRTAAYRQFSLEREMIIDAQYFNTLEAFLRKAIHREYREGRHVLELFFEALPTERELLSAIITGTISTGGALQVVEYHRDASHFFSPTSTGSYWQLVSLEERRADRQQTQLERDMMAEFNTFVQLREAHGFPAPDDIDQLFKYFYENFYSRRDQGEAVRRPFKVSKAIDRVEAARPVSQADERRRQERRGSLQMQAKLLLMSMSMESQKPKPPPRSPRERVRCEGADEHNLPTGCLEAIFMPSLPPSQRRGWHPSAPPTPRSCPSRRPSRPSSVTPGNVRASSQARQRPTSAARRPSLSAYERGTGRPREAPYFTTHYETDHGYVCMGWLYDGVGSVPGPLTSSHPYFIRRREFLDRFQLGEGFEPGSEPEPIPPLFDFLLDQSHQQAKRDEELTEKLAVQLKANAVAERDALEAEFGRFQAWVVGCLESRGESSTDVFPKGKNPLAVSDRDYFLHVNTYWFHCFYELSMMLKPSLVTGHYVGRHVRAARSTECDDVSFVPGSQMWLQLMARRPDDGDDCSLMDLCHCHFR